MRPVYPRGPQDVTRADAIEAMTPLPSVGRVLARDAARLGRFAGARVVR